MNRVPARSGLTFNSIGDEAPADLDLLLITPMGPFGMGMQRMRRAGVHFPWRMANAD